MNGASWIVTMLVAATATTGCAPMYGGAFGGPLRQPRAQRVTYEPPPIGRWDAVMSLKRNWIVEVLAADGTTKTGRFLLASVDALTYVENGIETRMPRHEVIRVDLVHAPRDGEGTARDVALGAAGGSVGMAASVAVIPFLISGKLWLPPARVWAVGAVAGGIGGLQRGRDERRPRTIYVARMNGM